MNTIRIQCSPEQEDVIGDHLITGKPLGMVPDERAWIMAKVRKVSTAKIASADLDMVNAEWVVTLQE